jgi:hypothetical protein
MALTLQTDDGDVADANSYASVAEFKTYWNLRGGYASASDPAIEEALVKARDRLDIYYTWKGMKLTGRTQETEWPRSQVYVADGQYDAFATVVHGEPFYPSQLVASATAVTGIPREVKRAQIMLARIALDQALWENSMSQSDANAVLKAESSKVDVIEESKTYAVSDTPGQARIPSFPEVDAYMLRSMLTADQTYPIRG